MKLTTGLLKRIIEEEIQKLSEEHEGLEGDYIEGTEAPKSATTPDDLAHTLINKNNFEPKDPKVNEASELKRIRAAKKLKLRESALENELKKVKALRAKIIKSLI